MILWILVTLNSLGVLFLLWLQLKTSYYTTFRAEYVGFKHKSHIGWVLTLWKRRSYGANGIKSVLIRYKNRQKEELRCDILDLKTSKKESRYQTLRAMYSWRETEQEKLDFKKSYREADPEFVDSLPI